MNGTKDDQTSSTSFTAIDAAKLNVTVPNNETDKLLVFFNAEISVLRQAPEHIAWSGSPSTTTRSPRCRTRTRLRQQYVRQHDANTQAQHAIVRVSPTLSAGAHTVKVEIATTSASTKFRYDDWTLAAQRIRVT